MSHLNCSKSEFIYLLTSAFTNYDTKFYVSALNPIIFIWEQKLWIKITVYYIKPVWVGLFADPINRTNWLLQQLTHITQCQDIIHFDEIMVEIWNYVNNHRTYALNNLVGHPKMLTICSNIIWLSKFKQIKNKLWFK